MLGGGGFGNVYKGHISKDLREGIQSITVAVKVHDGDNSYQGHREWLVNGEMSTLTCLHFLYPNRFLDPFCSVFFLWFFRLR